MMRNKREEGASGRQVLDRGGSRRRFAWFKSGRGRKIRGGERREVEPESVENERIFGNDDDLQV